ncbi:aminodeoxychorismate lyase, partial [Pseudoalteromonas sp. S1731]
PRERGHKYGEGFFTTAIVLAGHEDLWQYDKARMVACAER